MFYGLGNSLPVLPKAVTWQMTLKFKFTWFWMWPYLSHARAVEIGTVICKILWPWISRSSVKVASMGVGGMNSLIIRTLEAEKNLKDIIFRSRDTPNNDFRHEFDAMTSPRWRHNVRNKHHRMTSFILFWQGYIFRKSRKRKFFPRVSKSYRWNHTPGGQFDPQSGAKVKYTHGDQLLKTQQDFILRQFP